MSYLEIYNEVVVDLLGDIKKHLDVREDPNGKVFVSGLKEEIVTAPDVVFKLMTRGESKWEYPTFQFLVGPTIFY